MGDQVILACGLVPPAVTGIVNNDRGLRVIGGLGAQPGQAIQNGAARGPGVVQQADVVVVIGVGAEIGIDEDGLQGLDVLDGDGQRPLGVSDLSDPYQ